MAGGAISGASYGTIAGFVFIFNLVVGVGSLTLPHVFSNSGLVLGSIALAILASLAFITATFVIEALAVANAVKHLLKLGKKEKESDENEEFSVIRKGNEEPLLISGNEKDSVFKINDRVEMVDMAELFLGKKGSMVFLACLTIYLFGDLVIYAVAVPKSLASFVGYQVNMGSLEFKDFASYQFFVVIYAMVVLPFCFFNFAKTKFLQYFTLLMRNVSFTMMFVCVIVFLSSAQTNYPISFSHSDLPIFKISGFSEIFGTAIYAYMCHHSIPGIVSPIRDKSKLTKLFAADYLFIWVVNMALCWTAVIAFQNAPEDTCYPYPSTAPCKIQDLYTLNFQSFRVEFVGKFLVLFPAFTITTNYPLIAITFRNNVITLFKAAEESYTASSKPIPFWLKLFTNRIFVSALAAVPPLIIGFFTNSLGVIVGLTGSIAGLLIQYILPTILVVAARIQWKKVLAMQSISASAKQEFPERITRLVKKPEIEMELVDFNLDECKNLHKSPFISKNWCYGVLIWSVISLIISLVFQIHTLSQ
jgi:amino acid permease